jgi:hypothetical protein
LPRLYREEEREREREREREIWGFGQWAIKQEEKERHRFGVKS